MLLDRYPVCMTTAPKPTVLVIDARARFTGPFQAAVGPKVQVHCAPDAAAGLELLGDVTPDLILVYLRKQGVEACKLLRDRLGKGPRLVLYGDPMRARMAGTSAEKLAKLSGADRVITQESEGDDLGRLTYERLVTKARAADKVPLRKRTLDERVAKGVKDALDNDLSPVVEPDKLDASSSWGEILRGRISGQTLRVAWRKTTGKKD
jgi:chemotaxis response regulator CheB